MRESRIIYRPKLNTFTISVSSSKNLNNKINAPLHGTQLTKINKKIQKSKSNAAFGSRELKGKETEMEGTLPHSRNSYFNMA